LPSSAMTRRVILPMARSVPTRPSRIFMGKSLRGKRSTFSPLFPPRRGRLSSPRSSFASKTRRRSATSTSRTFLLSGPQQKIFRSFSRTLVLLRASRCFHLFRVGVPHVHLFATNPLIMPLKQELAFMDIKLDPLSLL
jgi:hypothetical protein